MFTIENMNTDHVDPMTQLNLQAEDPMLPSASGKHLSTDKIYS